MRRLLPALALTLVAASPALAQRSSRYEEERTASLDARGVRLIHIEGQAGELRITGRSGVTQVQVRGTARTNDRRWLADIKLTARRDGNVITIAADIPELDWRRSWRDIERALDLVIDVPAGIELEVQDGSGDTEIRNTGDLDVEDGSGDLTITDVAGDLRIHDGSGDVNVRGVSGSVVASDGSGDLEINDVQGSVRVSEDGSGDITVDHVGGSFTVMRDGSGSINYAFVSGTVDVPERMRVRRSSRIRTFRTLRVF